MGPNPLGGIMQMLPLLMLMPMLTGALGGGDKKRKNLTHSPGRNAAKYALAAVGLAGGVASGVVAPILVGVLTPSKILAPTEVDSPQKVGDYLNAVRKVNFAVSLTSGIGAGVGSVATGIAAMLAKA